MSGELTSKPDAPRLLYDWGGLAQAVAVTMWKHEIANGLGVCKGCGRLPDRELPMFGARCEIAVKQWDLAHSAMLRFAGSRATSDDRSARAIGRVGVPPNQR